MATRHGLGTCWEEFTRAGASGATVEAYNWARALAEGRGMRPIAARCQRSLGTILHEAQRLQAAIAMYGEMGMHFWGENSETALGAET